jgi:hypothetical protein
MIEYKSENILAIRIDNMVNYNSLIEWFLDKINAPYEVSCGEIITILRGFIITIKEFEAFFTTIFVEGRLTLQSKNNITNYDIIELYDKFFRDYKFLTIEMTAGDKWLPEVLRRGRSYNYSPKFKIIGGSAEFNFEEINSKSYDDLVFICNKPSYLTV